VTIQSVLNTTAMPVPYGAPYDALVLDAVLRQSLVTVRTLGQRGIRVAALETSAFRCIPTFASRWCQHAYVAPGYEQSMEPFVAYLTLLLQHTGARMLFTASDGTLELLRAHRALFEPLTRVAIANEAALKVATNKDQTLAVARQLGLNVPVGVTVTSVVDVKEALKTIGLPAVVKPNVSWLWGEQRGVRLICALVATPDEAYQAVERLTQDGGSVLLQKFLTGRREAMSFLYAHGEVYARFAQWARRTQPQLGGTSVYRKSIAVPDDIGTQAERLIREINLDGYSEVEFRRDADGTPYLMEINPRLSASVEVAVRAGVDFPYLIYQWAMGERIDHIHSYKTDKWMRFLEGDVITTLQALREQGRPGVANAREALFDFWSSFFVPSRYDYVDIHDPIPALVATQNLIDRWRVKRKEKIVVKSH
jgi:Predicted ATP-grasp enzyme